jgi:ABC-2 type transport system permease protein
MVAPYQSASDTRYGEVFDRGYAHYDGKLLGRRHAWWALTVYSMKRAMGIRKSWTAKILPFFLYLAAIVPVIVMVGVTAVVPRANIAGYANYFGAIFLIQTIFVATVAPEMLCVDRRENTLPFYFARSITRFDYVFAKLAATALLTMTLSVIPVVILWLGRQLVADSPGQAMRTHLDDLGKVILVGVLLALVIGAIGLAISSLTDRKAVAVAIILVLFPILDGIAGVAYNQIDASWTKYLLFIDPNAFLVAFNATLFPYTSDSAMIQDANWSDTTYIIYMAAIVVACALFVRWRYAPRD